MAKHRRRKSSARSFLPAGNGGDAEVARALQVGADVPLAFFSGYEGASFSQDRGMLHWHTLEARDELDSFSRGEITRRIHWLKANFGMVRGLIRNSADLVGWVTPQAEDVPDDWEALAEGRFRDLTSEAESFDVSGKFDFEEAQLMLMRNALTDGDVLTVMTRAEDGSARFAFYQTHQLASPKNAGKEWRDGIKVVKRKHVAYGLRDGDSDKVQVVPASSCIYFGEFDNPGEDRPVPPLAHAINHSIDITETWGFIKKAIKVSSLFATVREAEGNALPPRSRQGITGTPTVATTVDGQRVEVSDVWGGGQIPRLENGEKMKVLADDRPHPNYQDFTRMLVRDISVGFGLPPEVVWEIISMTGPGIRFVMDVADRWIKCRQKRLKKWARKVWRFTIACEIQAGRLPVPPASREHPEGAPWWRVSFTAQRNLTIDRGQMSRARLAELEAGVGVWADWQEFDGRDWKDRTRQRLTEVKFAMTEAGIEDPSPEEIYRAAFPPKQGAAQAAQAPGGAPPPGARPGNAPGNAAEEGAGNDTEDEDEEDEDE